MRSYIIVISLAVSLASSAHSQGYYMVGEPIQTSNGLRVNLQKNEEILRNHRAWDGEAGTLTLDAEFQSNYRLRVKIYNTTTRYEVPLEIQPAAEGSQNPLYEIQFENAPLFTFRIIRKSTGTILFNSSPHEEFIFADQYISLTWSPASENVYGIGENEQRSFRHDFSQNITWGLWSRDQPPAFTANMYGVHPYYTVLENDGNAHSVVLLNSNAQQWSMLSGPLIKYITIGGLLDFYVFLGPSPENTVQQYTEAVGRHFLPPYWSLGFQICRHGYNNLTNMKLVVDRNAQYGIPQDVQYGDIDIMDNTLSFTYDGDNFNGLPDYIRELKEKGIKFITILDPAISSGEDPEHYKPLKLGNEMDVWVKKQDGSPFEGKVWPEAPVYFPDFSRNSTKEWWRILVKEFHDLLEYDGLWIDMNEPSNFVDGDIHEGCVDNQLNNPLFMPEIADRSLINKTLCSDSQLDSGLHYNVHSLYGFFQSEPTLLGAREGNGGTKRSLVLSRSTFLGSGRWVAHWLGDNFSNWENLRYSIIGLLQFNHFGITLAGADICGFIGESNYELCMRWMQLGAFYPFSRNHNPMGVLDQDPAAWGAEFATVSKKILLVRYTLLPYLYTLFFRAANEGNTVARALWHEFPSDEDTWGIDQQFMWGSGFLISPALHQGVEWVNAYFPNARLYNYYNGMEEPTRGGVAILHTPMDYINLHVVGGNVLPTQEPAVNTQISRNNPFGLIVALDEQGTAKGSLFYDDGESLGTIQQEQYFLTEFKVSNGTLVNSIIKNGYLEMSDKLLTTVRLLGTGRPLVTSIIVNGAAHKNFTVLESGEVLISELQLSLVTEYTIEWS